MSIFTKIISGDLPSYKIAEDDNFFAFLDIFPLKEGHVLVIPKQEVDKIWDVSNEILSKWLVFAQPIAKAIEQAFPCNRCGMSVIGIEVPHSHMHLLPIDTADDINFTNPKLKLDEEQMKAIQQKIVAHL